MWRWTISNQLTAYSARSSGSKISTRPVAFATIFTTGRPIFGPPIAQMASTTLSVYVCLPVFFCLVRLNFDLNLGLWDVSMHWKSHIVYIQRIRDWDNNVYMLTRWYFLTLCRKFCDSLWSYHVVVHAWLRWNTSASDTLRNYENSTRKLKGLCQQKR